MFSLLPWHFSLSPYRPDGQKKAYVRLAPDYDALDVANKVCQWSDVCFTLMHCFSHTDWYHLNSIVCSGRCCFMVLIILIIIAKSLS